MRAIYWFRNDLRLQDNPNLLTAAEAADALLLVYIDATHRPWCNLKGKGDQRQRFLTESLQTLKTSIKALGQDLLVVQGSPELIIPELVSTYKIDALYTSKAPGVYEERAIGVLNKTLSIPVHCLATETLFSNADLQLCFKSKDQSPVNNNQAHTLPDTFSPFRRQVEKHLKPTKPVDAPTQLPAKLAVNYHPIHKSRTPVHVACPLRGGAEAGQRRLKQFLAAKGGIRDYKLTRNQLDPLGGTSTLSPWLANGNLSAREVAHAISKHEHAYGENESTYWLYFELLWREYFHWKAIENSSPLFQFGGQRQQPPLTTYNAQLFKRWSQGETNFPLINALMHQLLATGWMSNRGRQIVASCLVNELKIDWRFGAAFFEQHLIDYDVASNYGNWQYIAGVGADPRGGRHFNLEKQQRQFDPDTVFITKWDGARPYQPMHTVDASDWPIVDK